MRHAWNILREGVFEYFIDFYFDNIKLYFVFIYFFSSNLDWFSYIIILMNFLLNIHEFLVCYNIFLININGGFTHNYWKQFFQHHYIIGFGELLNFLVLFELLIGDTSICITTSKKHKILLFFVLFRQILMRWFKLFQECINFGRL